MKFIRFLQKNESVLFRSALVSLFFAFILLSCFVFFQPTKPIDLHISRQIQENHSPGLNTLMIWISWLGRTPVSAVMVILTSLVLLLFKYKREALLIFSTLLSGVLGLGMKVLVNRPRPSKDLVILLEETKYQSFPSGHVLFYTVFFGALILIILRLKNIKYLVRTSLITLCLLMIFLGAVSRIYLGAHWFTDVVGGFILGTLCVLIMGYFYIGNSKNVSEKNL